MSLVPMPDDNNNDNFSPLKNAIGAGHAMADFILADDAALAALAAFMNEADPAALRERVDAAHDVFVLLGIKVFLPGVFASMVRMASGGSEDDGDSDVIRTFQPPF